MAKYETSLKGNFENFVSFIDNDIENSSFSMNLVDKSDYTFETTKIAVRVYDKFFMRNSNRASLNVTIVANEDNIFISAIGAGGGSGLIFNFSLGAEDDMVYYVTKAVESFIEVNC